MKEKLDYIALITGLIFITLSFIQFNISFGKLEKKLEKLMIIIEENQIPPKRLPNGN